MVNKLPIHPKRRDQRPFVCIKCTGPCRSFKGEVHGWTCESCLAEYVNDQLAAKETAR